MGYSYNMLKTHVSFDSMFSRILWKIISLVVQYFVYLRMILKK